MAEPPRIAEVRLVVIILVNLADTELADAIAAVSDTAPVASVMASEVASNLASLSYVQQVIVSPL